MLNLVAIKALAGYNYVRADQVIAIRSTDPSKCDVFLVGGVIIPCSEPAAQAIAKLNAGLTSQAEAEAEASKAQG